MSKKKIKIFISLIILGLTFSALIFFFQDKIKRAPVILVNNPIIATCPTFSVFLESIISDNGIMVKTPNTATGLDLLRKKEAEYVLSGRPLMPGDGDYEQVFLDESGYSFIGSFEVSFYVDELKDFPIYTDLDPEIIRSDFNFDNLILVDDIYNRPEPSIAITSWDNTDYSRSKIVHIFNRDNSRHPLSRTPILYCDICGQEIIDLFKK